jgi:queuine tRNA-ribosyltransferase
MARCGLALLSPEAGGEARRRFRFDLTKAHLKGDSTPLDPACRCLCCRNYSRGYVRYLFSIREPLGARLVTIHNLTFMARLGTDIHDAIRSGQFAELYARWLGRPVDRIVS